MSDRADGLDFLCNLRVRRNPPTLTRSPNDAVVVRVADGAVEAGSRVQLRCVWEITRQHIGGLGLVGSTE